MRRLNDGADLPAISGSLSEMEQVLTRSQNSKVQSGKTKKVGKGGRRWYKDVGLGFRTPKTAIEGTYIDKKCPFTGLVSIRGRILTGTVVSVSSPAALKVVYSKERQPKGEAHEITSTPLRRNRH